MINEEKLNEQFINHEIRIRLLEKTVGDIKKLGFWILGTIIVGIAFPISLHSYGLI
jgi:replicative superfamily II helicase